MWLLPWNAHSDFLSQYEIGDQVPSFSDRSIWTLFHAKKKGTNVPLSIFRFDIREPGQSSIVDQAKQALKRIKTLRHPSILKYVDSCENDKLICIVTEGVSPLADYLNKAQLDLSQGQRDFSIAYGLLTIAKGLEFMNNGQLNHNNINIHSIFVNSSEVWKIGGLDYVCSVDEQPNKLHDGLDEKYTPPERLDPTKARHPGGKFAPDSWGMGCLVWECFNKPLTPSSSVKTVGKMPKQLGVHYNKLVQSSPKHRVSPIEFVNNCKAANVFFASPQLGLVATIEEIQFVKDPAEKERIFGELEGHLGDLPKDFCKNKILSDLINAFEFGEAGAAILNPLFKIGKLLNEPEFQEKLAPCIVKLYQCKDRATRAKLLQQIETYIDYLSEDVINNQLFGQIVQGFHDSNFAIRSQTIKSVFHLAPKLSCLNLNEELMKNLTPLVLRDKEGGIRANSAVCLTKIARHLSVETQTTILLPTLLNAMRDPFPPARHAAAAGLLTHESLFKDSDCANKIMPALCHLTLDADIKVRQLAFHALKLFIKRFEALSEKEAAATTTTTTSGGDKEGDTNAPLSRRPAKSNSDTKATGGRRVAEAETGDSKED